MRVQWLGAVPLVTIAMIAVGAACSSTDTPPALGNECTTTHCPDSGQDAHVVVPPSDGSTSDGEAGCPAPSDGGVSPEAATATVTGIIGLSSAPSFVVFPMSGYLSAPATVHYPYRNGEYVGDYDPGSDGGGGPNFTLLAPPSDGYVYVSDVNGQNGILDTAIGAHVENGGVFHLPAVLRAEFDAILAAQNPPLTRDPAKTQVIFSVETSPINGSAPVAGASFTLPGTKDTILYDVAGGTFSRGSSTGPKGIAIVVNYAEFGCAGASYHFAYTANGAQFSNLSFIGVAGKVVRVGVQLASQ